jgi:hypothetical protein
MPQVKVLTALLVFRLFYLLIPLVFAIVVVILFERRKLDEALRRKDAGNDETTACAAERKANAPESAGL